MTLRALAVVLTLAGVASAAEHRPVAVSPFRGKYCAGMGPKGWAVVAENAQRVAFGADFMSGDGKVYAGYSVFGAGSLMMNAAGYETPERAVATALSFGGQKQTKFGNYQQLSQNTFLIEFQNAGAHGMAFYEVFPSGQGGAVIVMRTAGAGLALWQTRSFEASAVARSIRCRVPNVPPAPDPPSLNAHRDPQQKNGEPDTLYNRWLDREYYHDPKTGENYWVSPSSDWSTTGSDGAGYYAPRGNEVIKLEPGYSQ